MSGESLRSLADTGASEASFNGTAFDIDAFRAVLDPNINRNRLLATDYLNHCNEVVMLIGLVADMPECMEEARGWTPKTYQAHFMDSGLSYKEQAVTAYENSPEAYRDPFDKIVIRLNVLVNESLDAIEAAEKSGKHKAAADIAMRASRDMQRLIDAASALMNGSLSTLGHDDVDDLFDTGTGG